LQFILTNIGDKLNKAEMDALIKEADEDGDGKIKYDAFITMMLSTI